MARTRSEIKDLVELNTGRTDKESLINSQCDSALKIAMIKHNFHDACHICDDVAITEDTTSVAISSLTESSISIGTIIDVVTARIVEDDGSKNTILKIKNRQWWDKNIINPEDNLKGWPTYGLHFGANIIFDRPVDSGLSLRLRVASVPTFESDSTECPISSLDLFIEQYVTAMVFLSIGKTDNYLSWYMLALGRDYDRGVIGGTLLSTIDKDKYSAASDNKVERGVSVNNNAGITIQDLDNDRSSTWY